MLDYYYDPKIKQTPMNTSIQSENIATVPPPTEMRIPSPEQALVLAQEWQRINTKTGDNISRDEAERNQRAELQARSFYDKQVTLHNERVGKNKVENSERLSPSTERVGSVAAKSVRSEVVVEEVITPETGSYQNGWGFFEAGNKLDPDEFVLTQNDDLYVDTVILGLDRPEKFSKIDRKLPLSPERSKIAQEGICRAIEAKHQLTPGTLKDIREARNYLQSKAAQSGGAISTGAIHYQNISMVPKNGVSLADHVGSHGDFLHFGASNRRQNNLPDKLEEVMRAYVYTPPEYSGHVAATIINEVRTRIGREVYLKLYDYSTKDNGGEARADNLIIYGQTHGEMVVIADTLRRLATDHPEMFDPQANPIDFARKTGIPAVSIAEEPMQHGGMVQSFNQSRSDIARYARDELYKRFFNENPNVAKRYKIDNTKGFFLYDSEKALREFYNSLDATRQATLHKQLKTALLEEVKKQLHVDGVSERNFAMNSRPSSRAQRLAA